MDGNDHVHGGDARGGGLRVVEATEEEQAAISQLLKERGSSSARRCAGAGDVGPGVGGIEVGGGSVRGGRHGRRAGGPGPSAR
jgi:hypothetical protein